MGESIRCHKNINMWRIIIFSIILTIVTGTETNEKRKPKLFFVSTSSTSTLSTRTLCYTTNTALTTCGRKKRAIADIREIEGEISPAPIQKLSESEDEDMEIEDDFVAGGINEDTDRGGKFLLYWMTTTLTSTTTSYTVTQTLSALECTPAAGFSLTACGK